MMKHTLASYIDEQMKERKTTFATFCLDGGMDGSRYWRIKNSKIEMNCADYIRFHAAGVVIPMALLPEYIRGAVQKWLSRDERDPETKRELIPCVNPQYYPKVQGWMPGTRCSSAGKCYRGKGCRFGVAI